MYYNLDFDYIEDLIERENVFSMEPDTVIKCWGQILLTWLYVCMITKRNIEKEIACMLSMLLMFLKKLLNMLTLNAQ